MVSKKEKPKKKQKKQKNPMAVADELFSEYIRKRDGTCLYGRDTGDPCNGYLQASHVISKGACSELRHNPNNAVALCNKHHIYGWHSRNPAPYVDWFIRTFPQRWEYLCGVYAGYKLKLAGGKGFKPTKEHYRRIIDFYQNELAKEFDSLYG